MRIVWYIVPMILTQEEINKLGDENGFGTPNEDYIDSYSPDYSKGMLWYDGDPTELIRAAEKLILEKLDDKK